MACRFDIWIHLRYLRTKKIYNGWSCHLVRFKQPSPKPRLRHSQGYWLHHRQCFSKYRHAHRRPCHQWLLCWHLLRPSPGLHLRIGTSKQARTSCRSAAMGNNMGDNDNVLYLIWVLFHQRHSRVPTPLGPSDDSSHSSLHRDVLPPRIASMASSQGSLGGLSRRTHPCPWQRRPKQPFRRP